MMTNRLNSANTDKYFLDIARLEEELDLEMVLLKNISDINLTYRNFIHQMMLSGVAGWMIKSSDVHSKTCNEMAVK